MGLFLLIAPGHQESARLYAERFAESNSFPEPQAWSCFPCQLKIVTIRTQYQRKIVTSVIIEDQNPIMRRAKIRVAVAFVLLCVALGSLLKMSNSKQAAVPDTRIISSAPSATTTPEPPATKAKAQPQVISPPQEEAKPPSAPPEPVYQSFTAEPSTQVESLNGSALPPLTDNSPAVGSSEKVLVVATPEKNKKPAPDKESPKVSASGTYILQAGVFGDMANARKQMEKLSGSGIQAHSETKLWIGPFATEQDAGSARDVIQSSGLNIPLQDSVISSAKGLMMVGGIHTDMEHAATLRNSLGEKGLPARTETRVLVGPFDTKDNADKARNRIKKLNIGVVLMRTGS